MAWMPVDQFLPKHQKTLALARELRCSRHEAAGILIEVWGWAIDHAPTGQLLPSVTRDAPGPVTRDIRSELGGNSYASVVEAVAILLGSRTDRVRNVLASLREVGWIDEDGRLHEWDQWAGRLVVERAQNRDRQRRKREKLHNSDNVARDSPSGHARQGGERVSDMSRVTERDVTRMSRSQTRVDKTRVEPPSPTRVASDKRDAGSAVPPNAEVAQRELEDHAEQITTSATGTWATVLDLLSAQAREEKSLRAFITWYQGTSMDEKDSVFYVSVPNEFAREQLESKMLPDLRATIGIVTQQVSPDVRVVVKTQETTKRGAA